MVTLIRLRVSADRERDALIEAGKERGQEIAQRQFRVQSLQRASER